MRGKRNIGLSIGPSKIAVAEVHIDSDGEMEIDRVSTIDTPDSSFYQGRVTNAGSIVRALQELLTDMGISGVKEAALTISDEGVITRMQSFPFMSRGETLEALVGEVENYAAMAGGEPAIDYQNITATESGQQPELLFAATPRESLDSYLLAMEEASLKLSAIETISLSVLRAITNLPDQGGEGSLPPFEPDKPAMIISIEENVGMLVIIRNKNVQFVHNMESGAKDLRGQMDFRKRELAREISSSVEYYHNEFPDGGQIENAILVIDGSDTNGFREILENSLGLPVITPPTPMTAMEDAEEKIADCTLSAYAAIGAALRVHIKDDSSINLLSSSRRGSAVGSMKTRVTMILLIIVSTALLAAGARVYAGRKADEVEQDLISLRMNQAVSEAEAAAQVPVIQAGINALTLQLEATDTAMNSIQWPNIVRMFEEVRAIIPRTVWLIRLSWNSGNVSFEGFGMSWDEVAKFRDVLLDSPYFDPVTVRSENLVEMDGRSIIRFSIQCGVKLPK